MSTIEQRKESYKELIRQLVLSGFTDVSAMNDERSLIIDIVAWALFRTLSDGREALNEATACAPEGIEDDLINGRVDDYFEKLKIGMAHHLADAIQAAIDVVVEAERFGKTSINEEEQLDNKGRAADMRKENQREIL